MQPAIFLDRDGVIIENRPDYVRSWQDVEIYPQALAALERASKSLYKLVVVTNQSAVGRGLLGLAEAQAINQKLRKVITRAGGRIDGIFMCPHTPEDNCACRKPKPGLLLQAAAALDLDLTRSVLIGDAWSDLQAGQAAGVCLNILVLTGRGAEQRRLPPPRDLKPYQIYPHLTAAIDVLLGQ